MKKNYLHKVLPLISFICLVNSISTVRLHAQTGIQGTQSHKIRWLSSGALRSWFDNFGSEGEYFRRERTMYVAQDQIDGLCWPNEYNARMKGVKCAKGLWIGTTNFNDPVTNTTYPYKVIGTGPFAVYTGTEIIADESFGDAGISMIGKFNHPSVLVDKSNASARNEDDEIDQLDPSISSDRIIINTFNTSIGLTVTRKIIASSQQYNDNYFIYEYTFKNTGIIDETGEQKLITTLTDLVFYFLSRYSFAGESYTGKGVGDWFPAASSWGRNTVFDHVGQDANHQLAAPNDFQAMFAYYGPHTSTPYGSPAGDIGLPGPRAFDVWTLAGTQFAGVVLLHADRSPYDQTHDKTKLITTQCVGADQTRYLCNYSGFQYNPSVMAQKYLEFMTAGHSDQTQAELLGKDENGWPNAFANTFGTDPGGFMGTQGFGPYTLAPGDSVRIVLAEAVAGISREKIYEVAENWFMDNSSEFLLPEGYKNGTITTDRNEYKNAWVFSGKDSLFQTFRRAIDNYNNNYNVPQPPPPPDNFQVNTGADRIELSWSNNADLWPNFDGFMIFRAAERADTIFEKIFECDKSSIIHSFDDTTAERGLSYYYYIQTKDDGSTNPGNPDLNFPAGEPLVSSKYYTMTGKPVSLLPASSGDFCSYQSGDWNDVNNWMQFNGSDWEYPAAHIPDYSDNSITILSGHTIIFSNSDTINQLQISGGTLIVNEGAVLHVKDTADKDLIVNGSIKNFGQITKDDSALIVFEENGNYYHGQDGGTIPIAVWNPGSTCQFDSIKSVVPINIKQNFYNVVWDCPNQTGEINLGWNGGTIWSPIHGFIDEVFIYGNVYVKNTGTGVLLLCLPDPDSIERVTIYGDFIQSGGHFSVSNTNDPATKIIVSHNGNFSLTGGNFSISSGSQGDSGTTVWNFVGSDVTISNSTIQNLNPAGAKFVFAQLLNTITLGENNNIISLPIEVISTLNIGTHVLEYSGSFILHSGATLEISHTGGLDSTIKVSGLVSFSKGANYNFRGSAHQVTGNLLPDTVGNFIIDNEDGISLSVNVVVNGILEMKRGAISLDGNLLSYGSNGTLKYSGIYDQTTTDLEFPLYNGPTNLTINNQNKVILHSSRIIPGMLNLSGKLILGDNNLTVDSISNQQNPADVYVETNGNGVLKLISSEWQKLFPIGTKTGYSPVWVANSGASDTISLSVTDDYTKAVGGARVKAKWKMSENTQGDGNYTIKFGWSGSLEDSVFKTNRREYSRIFQLSDTTEIGSGSYSTQSSWQFYTVQRGGITVLDTFVVGYFTGLTDIEKYELGIPTEFRLSQNYPNPFNPSTKIRYEIPVETKVLIKVYDILGREVATLINEYQKPGRYQVEWNAGNLASGVYFYSIKAGDFSAIKKLLLLK